LRAEKKAFVEEICRICEIDYCDSMLNYFSHLSNIRNKPRFPKAAKFKRKLGHMLRGMGLQSIINISKLIGVENIIYTREKAPAVALKDLNILHPIKMENVSNDLLELKKSNILDESRKSELLQNKMTLSS
jgi:hypothetical protein